MNKERVHNLFSKAYSDLSRARDELLKPKEDVVTYSACISARSSLYYFLSCLYVLNSEEDDKGEIEKGTKTIDELIEEVSKHYESVGEIDFSPMRCSCKDIEDVVNNEEIYFCNNVQIVETCTNLAEKVRELVINDAFGRVEPETDPLSGQN